MTSVLSATDPLRRDRIMGHDDNQINFSSVTTDWRAKYNEVADMLAETRAELEDFQHSSKELEEELERELERTEKAQQELKVKAARAESERDEWKSKFMSLQTTHNTTTTSLQRELDTLRKEHQQVKVQLRELEMGNDDLERNERAIASSLADVESKYSRVLEEKILLEHELLDKAHLEEECQRLRDELRDANEEIVVMKDQLSTAQSRTTTTVTELSTPPSSAPASDENLLRTAPPADLQLSDLSPSCSESSAPAVAPPSPPAEIDTLKSQRTSFSPSRSIRPPASASPFTRSTTMPALSKAGNSRAPTTRPALATRTNSSNSTVSAAANSGTASRSKGVQMVSEMRARVKNLEQKIHTRVPRLRMGSVTGKISLSEPTSSPVASSSTPPPSGSSSTLRSTSSRRSAESYDSQKSDKRRVASPSDSTGWVLIMEDSPTPVKDKKDKERRRSASPLRPLAPSAFRSPKSSVDETELYRSPTGSPSRRNKYALSKSTGLRRPQSRLSVGGTSASTTTSSIHTPLSSRPSTPTFLPLPTSSSSIYASSGLKKSMGPGAKPFSQPKRSSLGSSVAKSPTDGGGFNFRERPLTMPPPPRPGSGTSTSSATTSSDNHGQLSEKELPRFPESHSNVTLRAPSKFSVSSSLLSQSRIGRPMGRRSGGPELSDGEGGRGRSGSSAVYGRSAT
ncbi:hypothetical protein NEOLEDRAFT_1104339 [Neolentinus lepideus HHB14362 ss-1]|uniref:NUDE domain-containing protein n=1 Tax=Neolentinus lepideus HHB14362 ss-1 TaxID=1314782 RepID=A0A165W190_9AGAM|nr:hypothetical protein NEOLEDRAFT_1104339 [Neolentinus lepideus HHB14362 ss-1]